MKPGDQISYFFANRLLGFWKMARDGSVTWTSQRITKSVITNPALSRLAEPWRLEGLEPFFDDSITKSYKPHGTP